MTDHRLTIHIREHRNGGFIAVPNWQRVEIIVGGPDSIAEGETEEECMKAVEQWIADIPVFPVPQPMHPKVPATQTLG